MRLAITPNLWTLSGLCLMTSFLTPAGAAEPAPAPAGKDTGLIPRAVLFGNPDKSMARISPDGKQLAYLAPVNGVMNVWVGPVDKPDDAKAVTNDKKRGIRSYFWAYSGQHVLYTQDADGDEDWHIYRVDLKSGETKDLTPLKKIDRLAAEGGLRPRRELPVVAVAADVPGLPALQPQDRRRRGQLAGGGLRLRPGADGRLAGA